MLVYIRGAGDIASGVALRLYRAGMELVMSDLAVPTAVRRSVAFSEAIRLGSAQVEEVSAKRAESIEDVREILSERKIAVLVDSGKESIRALRPDVVVDAILAKRNLGTSRTDAPIVLGIGPGFFAGIDCHAVIETKRGHTLGRAIYRGAAIPNTGVPGNIAGVSAERVLRSPAEGIFRSLAEIGQLVSKGETVAYVDGIPLKTEIPGMLRGLLQDGIPVFKGMKCGDVDPRGESADYKTVSDKALAVGGGVLEALLHFISVGESAGEPFHTPGRERIL